MLKSWNSSCCLTSPILLCNLEREKQMPMLRTKTQIMQKLDDISHHSPLMPLRISIAKLQCKRQWMWSRFGRFCCVRVILRNSHPKFVSCDMWDRPRRMQGHSKLKDGLASSWKSCGHACPAIQSRKIIPILGPLFFDIFSYNVGRQEFSNISNDVAAIIATWTDIQPKEWLWDIVPKAGKSYFIKFSWQAW